MGNSIFFLLLFIDKKPMIDQFTIFSKSGVILWNLSNKNVTGNPIQSLISSVLLETNQSSSTPQRFDIGEYFVKYRIDDNFELIFTVVYKKILPLPYIDDLLDAIKLQFVKQYNEVLKSSVGNNKRFSAN